MVRTLEDALHFIEAHRLVTESPTPGCASLAAVVTGAGTDAWRSHSKGRLVYRLTRKLRGSPEVLSLRLLAGKLTFVHPSLWPEVLRVVMEPTRRRRSLEGLSPDARALLSGVEREGSVTLASHSESAKAREALEQRLLVHSYEVHTEAQPHTVVLRSWRAFAPPELLRVAGDLSYEDALSTLREHAGASASLGPWVY